MNASPSSFKKAAALPSRIWLSRKAIAIVGILLAAYSLVYVGDCLGSWDEIIRYLTTDNLIRGRGFRAEYLDNTGAWKPWGGPVIPNYGFLHPVFAAPLHALSLLFRSGENNLEETMLVAYEVPIQKTSLAFVLCFNPLIAAAICLVFFHCARRLGFSSSSGFYGALLLGLCTMLFAYTPLFFTEPLTALLLVLAYYSALGLLGRDVFICGLFAGLLPCNNAVFLFSAPVFMGSVLLNRSGLRWQNKVMWFLLGFAPGLVFLVIQIVLRGSLGYSGEVGFITPLAIGLFGNLFSPGKSLFVFSPVALLGCIGYFFLYRSHPRPTFLALALLVPPLLVYSKWFNWAGGTCWGPRFLLPLLPLIMLGALPIIEKLSSCGRLLKVLVLFFLLGSFWVQLSATLVPAYSWFHFTARHLDVRMADNRFERRGLNDPLLFLQTVMPYFPEYCPPYLQTMAFIEILRERKFDHLAPGWIRYRRWGWAAASLILLGTSLILGIHKDDCRYRKIKPDGRKTAGDISDR